MVSFRVTGVPVAKPRMTQRDRWAQRPAVVRYRAYADALRLAAPKNLPTEPMSIMVTFRIPMPATWPKWKRQQMIGAPHRQKPDLSNLLKSVEDALWPEDSLIAHVQAEKFWTSWAGMTLVYVRG